MQMTLTRTALEANTSLSNGRESWTVFIVVVILKHFGEIMSGSVPKARYIKLKLSVIVLANKN